MIQKCFETGCVGSVIWEQGRKSVLPFVEVNRLPCLSHIQIQGLRHGLTVLVHHPQAAGHDLIELSVRAVASCELRAPYPARNMHCCTFLDQVHVVYVLSLPGCDVEPCRLGDRIALSCLVKDVCDQ